MVWVRQVLVLFFMMGAVESAADLGPIGLVLSGGAARGAYEVGVWKALCERGLADQIRVFSGTSVGAINAAIFASVRDPNKCAQIWREEVRGVFSANPEVFVNTTRTIGESYIEAKRDVARDKKDGEKPTWKDKVKRTGQIVIPKVVGMTGNAFYGSSKSVGFCDSGKLREALGRHLLEDWNVGAPFVYVTTFEKSKMETKVFLLNRNKREHVIDYVMASAAVPVGYGSVEIGGGQYIDGGIRDNTPVKPIVDKHPEVETIVVVYLKDEKRLKGKCVSSEDFPGVKFIEIIPSKDIHGRFGLGSVDTSSKNVESLIQLGYDDAMGVLKEIEWK